MQVLRRLGPPPLSRPKGPPTLPSAPSFRGRGDLSLNLRRLRRSLRHKVAPWGQGHSPLPPSLPCSTPREMQGSHAHAHGHAHGHSHGHSLPSHARPGTQGPRLGPTRTPLPLLLLLLLLKTHDHDSGSGSANVIPLLLSSSPLSHGSDRGLGRISPPHLITTHPKCPLSI